MFISCNGKIQDAGVPVIRASSQGYRYGDGLFETIKTRNGQLLLAGLHFERLFHGLSVLGYQLPGLFTPELITNEINRLIAKNKIIGSARIRLSVTRGSGGLYDGDDQFQWLLECWPLSQEKEKLNENGLLIDVFPDARKSIDILSGLKSASFLPYSLAAQWVIAQKLNDCVLLNTEGGLADATIANLFIVKDGQLRTPGPSEGAVDGVMRKYLIRELKAAGLSVTEGPVTVEELEYADEAFLTNAISGIRWVGVFRDKVYGQRLSTEIYNRYIKTISI